jgi:hypothetical protein
MPVLQAYQVNQLIQHFISEIVILVPNWGDIVEKS